MTRLAVLIAILGVPLAAQYPFPGGYPAGPYPPMGGAKIPAPGHHRKGRKKANQPQQIIGADGRTVSNDGKKLVVHTPDGRWLTMTVTTDTKFIQGGNAIPAAKIGPRTRVHVEAAEDDRAFLTAVSVELLKEVPAARAPAPPSQPAASAPATQETAKRPAMIDAPEAPGAPILRHGKPNDPSLYAGSSSSPNAPTSTNATSRASKKPDGDFDFTIASPIPPPAVRVRFDALIEKARHWVATFTNGLPNYLCNQDTTRYMEQSRDSGWEAQDVVTAKVVYDHGHEEYRDITVGGKKTKKSMMALGGQTSTGEFASMLYSLFNPAREAEFTFDGPGSTGGAETAIYKYKVLLPRSDWTIVVGGQTLRPAYSGSVWIEKKTAVVRRIEMQANNIPHDFPMDYVETAVDYDLVSLGAKQFLLPVHSENVSCQRGSTLCAKNTIDFRDYKKFEGQSTITYGK
ncbi:MAG: hypothetical protein ACRD4O_18000 [Bryobacteraceae bacterium]